MANFFVLFVLFLLPLLNIAYHIKLLISPHTRTLTKRLYTDLLRYLIQDFASIIWFYLGHSHPEIAQRAFEASERELAAARQDIQEQRATLQRLIKSHCDDITEKKSLNSCLRGRERQLKGAIERAERIDRTVARKTIAQWGQKEDYLLTRVNELELMVVQRDGSIETWRAESQFAWNRFREQFELTERGEDALRKEMHNMTLRNNEMQRKNFEQAQKVAAFERVLDVLHELARQDGEGGERLPVAVGFALAFQRAGMDVRAVQVLGIAKRLRRCIEQ